MDVKRLALALVVVVSLVVASSGAVSGANAAAPSGGGDAVDACIPAEGDVTTVGADADFGTQTCGDKPPTHSPIG